MSDIKTKDKAQRKEYIEKLMNDDTLLKAAMWLLVYEYKLRVHDMIAWLHLSDYHGIDIINNPELYDTEIVPAIEEMIETKPYRPYEPSMWKIFDSDDYIDCFKKFLKKEKKIYCDKHLRLYILERSYRAWAHVNNLTTEVMDNDFRYDKKFKI